MSRSRPPRPVRKRAGAVAAALGLVVGIEAEVNERVAMRVGDDVDGTARAAVAAVRPARGTNFSRRKLREPLPPSPALMWMSTSSTNMQTRDHEAPELRGRRDSWFLARYSTGWTEMNRPR